MELTTKSTIKCHKGDQQCLFGYMRQESTCSQNIQRSYCVGVGQCLHSSFLEPESFCFPPPFPPSVFSAVFISVMGACLPSRAWGLMAGFPGFATHGSGLNLGAGCQ